MCHRTIKGILGSFPKALIYEYLVLVFLGGFYCCEIVVGRFDIVVGRFEIVVGRCEIVVDRCGSLWIVVGRCGSLWVVVGRCGSLWVVPAFSDYVGIVVGRCGSLSVVVGRCGTLWLVPAFSDYETDYDSRKQNHDKGNRNQTTYKGVV